MGSLRLGPVCPFPSWLCCCSPDVRSCACPPCLASSLRETPPSSQQDLPRCGGAWRKLRFMCRDFPRPLLPPVDSQPCLLAMPYPLLDTSPSIPGARSWLSLAITLTRCLRVLRCRRQGSVSQASFRKEHLCFAKLTSSLNSAPPRGLAVLCTRVFPRWGTGMRQEHPTTLGNSVFGTSLVV